MSIDPDQRKRGGKEIRGKYLEELKEMSFPLASKSGRSSWGRGRGRVAGSGQLPLKPVGG